MSTTSTYTVTGMTCGHCAASVREEIEALPGVTSVEVTVDDGSVRVSADRELGRDEVATAVTEAGYVLV
ncbi:MULTISPECIES: heavy-metal-associated domain-containing protein [Gordonia]|uniref:Heavy-metal-associated domain-containing protein n=2 Tax=Gordonia terrae TaxID=2055 RepID=A0AAD0KG52_9ACTN|nr:MULTISPECIES: heavy metal-associated domain-containing protein [Gordonia]VTR08322.1 copper-binding protein [Clostridioides difficile]ANY25405.1 cation-transporting ATPase [Gordonia terrae]AWO86157.1 heavy-metal-associated domain-containing protein [Gordonia terrae]MCG7633460.1 heavy-metal-associated domain-containing protein [Gordonia sp. McavH-238-E]VTS63151.1 Mercuric reductase [Gordonia terrae]